MSVSVSVSVSDPSPPREDVRPCHIATTCELSLPEEGLYGSTFSRSVPTFLTKDMGDLEVPQLF